MLRINPLRREPLADAALDTLLAQVHRTERAAHALAAECSDELYALIGRTEGGERSLLVALRRAIHNDRLPARMPRSRTSRTPAVGRWLALRRERDGLRAAVAERYDTALAVERARMGALLGDADLRRALALLAPEVDDAAARYRQALDPVDPASPGGLSARLRKSERGLLQYLTRAMIRTSPLSRFTAVGLAVPDRGRTGVPHGGRTRTHTDEQPAVVDPRRPHFGGALPVPAVDRVMMGHIAAGLPGAAPDTPEPLDADTWVQQPPTAETDPETGRYSFLRLREGRVQRLAAPASPVVRALLLLTAMGPRRCGAVAADAARHLDVPEERALRTVADAVRAGILCTAAGPDDWHADLLAPPAGPSAGPSASPSASPSAGPSPGPASDGVHAALRTVRTELPRLADAPAPERTTALASVRKATDALSRAAGRPASVVVEEDYVLPPSRVAARALRSQLADLAAVVEFQSAFDRLHDVRALLTTVFTERFGKGAGVPLHAHADALVREVYDRELRFRVHGESGLGPGDGCLEELRGVRESAVARLHSRLDALPDGTPETVWDPAELSALVAGIPERFRRDPVSYGVLVQPHQDRLIVNDAYGGHGMLYGRFLDADRAQGGTAHRRLARRLEARYGYGGALVAEDLGLHRLNVNAHPPVLDRGLDAEDWYTLRLVHDPDADRLRLETAEGRELRVLTLGAGFPELYPAPLRLATWLISGGRLTADITGAHHRANATDPRPPRGALPTRAHPRLVAGDVVFSRRRWYPGDDLPAALSAPSDLDRLLALTEWRARHGVPREVVLKTVPDLTRRAATEDRRRQKPQYADLHSALLTRVLPRFLERRGSGYVEEALPGADASEHAFEWVVEISRGPGEEFAYDMTEVDG